MPGLRLDQGTRRQVAVFFAGLYLATKVADMFIRGSYVHLIEGSLQSYAFIMEMVFGVIVPFFMLL